MLKMPNPCKNHGGVGFVGGGDGLLVPLGAAGLDDSRHARLGGNFDPVGHRTMRICFWDTTIAGS